MNRKLQTVPVRVRQFENVAGGTTAFWNAPAGNAYHELRLKTSGVTIDQIQRVRIMVNGIARRTYTGAELNLINVYDGYPPFADIADPLYPGGTRRGVGTLRIPFTMRPAHTPENEVLTALTVGVASPTSGKAINSLKVEIDLAPTATPLFDCIAVIGEPDPAGPGLIYSTFRDTQAATTEHDFDKLYVGGVQQALLRRHFLFAPTIAQVQTIEVRRNNQPLFETDVIDIAEDAAMYERPVLGQFLPVDPTMSHRGGNVFDMSGAADYRLRMTSSAAHPQVTILSEFLGEL